MNDPHRDDPVACKLCGKEVPRSAARTAEGRDYAYFFCSEGCRQRWAANQQFDKGTGTRHP